MSQCSPGCVLVLLILTSGSNKVLNRVPQEYIINYLHLGPLVLHTTTCMLPKLVCELNIVPPTPVSGRIISFCLLFQVLDVIAPPYTSDFVQLFLPILENESIAGTIKTEGEHDPVTEFIGKSHLFLAYLLALVSLTACK